MRRSGIDVSKWQGKIGWEKVKASGQVEFALLRAGYGDALSCPDQNDPTFEYNYTECKRVGIPVGVYWYSYATTPEMAVQEAKSCIAALKGKQFEYPIYYDVEEMRIFNTGRTNEIIKAFCDEMEKAGYWVGIYIYRSAAQAYLSDYTRNRYAMAVAEYGPKLNYTGQCGIWQNSGTWKVDGINTDVDHDWCYVDYPKLIKEKGKNGYPKPAPELIYTTTKETPIVSIKGTVPKGKTVKIGGRKTVCGVQYGRIAGTKDDWIALTDAEQIS